MKSQASPGAKPSVRPHSHAKAHPARYGRVAQVAVFTVLPACVSAAAVWALLDVAAPDVPAPPPSGGTVQIVGQVVAVTPNTITTRSPDGITTTFQITAATARYNSDGATNSLGRQPFSVNETVTVMGVVRNGTAVATALADQNAGGGPPMDAA